MKENNFNTIMTDADFDDRCRTMLEASEAVAPEPRADLFADAAPKAAGMGWVKWGAAAIVLAGAVLWATSPNPDTGSSHPVQSMEQEAPVNMPEVAESESVLMASPTEDAVAAELPASEMEGVTTPSPESLPVASSAPVPSTQKASEAPSIEPKPEGATATSTMDDPATGHSELDAGAELEVEGPSALNNGADAVLVETPVPAAEANPEMEATPEEAPKTSPKLTLPLTLPSGGGQR